MGGSCSKFAPSDVAVSSTQAPPPPPPPPPPLPNFLPTSPSAAYIRSLRSTCASDPELQLYDSALLSQMELVVNSISGGDEAQFLSIEYLRVITGCYSDVNHGAVKYLLALKEDVWNSPQLFDLVEQYFLYSDQVLAFFNTLNQCLNEVKQRQFFIEMALHYFETEAKISDETIDVSLRFAQTLQEMKNFKETDDPFGEEFGATLQSVHDQQILMLAKLELHQKKLQGKLKSIRLYKKASYVIFAACFVGVIVLSIVAAVLAAPPVLTAVAGALSAPTGGMGKWMSSLWKKYEDELKPQIGLVGPMLKSSRASLADLRTLKVLVGWLEVQIKDLEGNAGLTLSNNSMVIDVVEDMKKKLDGFSKAMRLLEENASKYDRDIRRARTVILAGIMNGRGSSSSGQLCL